LKSVANDWREGCGTSAIAQQDPQVGEVDLSVVGHDHIQLSIAEISQHAPQVDLNHVRLTGICRILDTVSEKDPWHCRRWPVRGDNPDAIVKQDKIVAGAECPTPNVENEHRALDTGAIRHVEGMGEPYGAIAVTATPARCVQFAWKLTLVRVELTERQRDLHRTRRDIE
jgi:hypothetical protein